MTIERDIILNLLNNLGSTREVGRYLETFASGGRGAPVVIKIGGNLLDERLDQVAASIACLGHLGVCPIIVHGAGPQVTEALGSEGVRSRFIDGLRVTTAETLRVMRRVIDTVGERLASRIGEYGIRTRRLDGSVFSADRISNEAIGYVGHITRVHEHLIERSR
ncbi:MAG: hypothetical protein ACF8GE_04665, partial [Phycisphaerales bacterium JB043]